MKIKQCILNKIDANKTFNIQFLSDLVACDTRILEHGRNGNEANGQKLVRQFLEKEGALVDEFEPAYADMDFCPEVNPDHDYQNRPNVVGVFKGAGGGRSLLFNGHIDTVDFGGVEKWTQHPLKPYIDGDKLIGRGACDMKGGLCAALMAMKAIRDSGIRLKGDVIFESVVDEEGGGNGTLACCARGYKADAAIIPEPSDLWLAPAHMGWLIYKVTVTGVANHCGAKWDGVNAIEKMAKIIANLQDAEREWAISRRHPYLPPQSISIDTINGGMASTIVPDKCELEFIVHFQPHSEPGYSWMGEKYDNEVRDVIARAAQSDAWMQKHPPEVELYQLGSACDIGPEHAICKTLSDKACQVLNHRPKVKGLVSGADGRLLNNYGKTPTVHFGPGSMEIAHTIDEYVPISEYLDCIRIFALTIMDWCGVEDAEE